MSQLIVEGNLQHVSPVIILHGSLALSLEGSNFGYTNKAKSHIIVIPILYIEKSISQLRPFVRLFPLAIFENEKGTMYL